jgi:hypothetical protein
VPLASPLRVSDSRRRARLADRHLLASHRPADAVLVTGAVVALHSTDPASVHLSAAARGALPISSGLDSPLNSALYERRELVRTLAMRRTVVVVPSDFAAIVHAGATRAVAARERKRLLDVLAGTVVPDRDPSGFLAELEEATLAELAARGEAYGAELGDAVPGLRKQLVLPAGTQSLTTRVLSVLAAEGRIVRGRPRGSWLSSQYRWALAPEPVPSEQELPTAAAQIELARAYLRAYAPATPADLQWWTGWTAGETRRALAGLATQAVQLEDGKPALVLADDLDDLDDVDEARPAPPCARLLPALDASTMGWAGRDFYLDPAHRDHTRPDALFDRSGNPGPTIWWDGRVVGGWAQRRDGEVAIRLLADIGKDGAAQVAAEAERVAGWLGDVRVTPRFRTPLERALAG